MRNDEHPLHAVYSAQESNENVSGIGKFQEDGDDGQEKGVGRADSAGLKKRNSRDRATRVRY